MRSAITNRIDEAFVDGQPALICYLPVGDPRISPHLPKLYADAGVDILELGVPVRDPILDGPTITDSMQRAIAAGMNTERAADTIRSYREALPNQPMVWMSYLEERASEEFARLATASGVDGVLMVAETENLSVLAKELDRHDLYLLGLIGHELPVEDIQAARKARGYVMLQATPGVTGAAHETIPDSGPKIKQLREEGVTEPIALGIGISTPHQARKAVEMGADAVVIGSATLEAALKGETALDQFLKSLRRAVDGG